MSHIMRCDLDHVGLGPTFAGAIKSEQFRTHAQESYLRNNLATKPSAYQRLIIVGVGT